eukprot:Nk52_evm1s1599 gene=Nk52_evmTU1s1599
MEVAMDPDKLTQITKFPVPHNRTGVRSFLGLCGFYRKFIKNFAQLSSKLTDLLKKDVPFDMTGAPTEAFQKLKEALSEAVRLRRPDPHKKFFISCDASTDVACGGSLNQKDETGNLYPLMFTSRKFSRAECNYSITEKELLAILYCLSKWRHYLHLTRFTILTDHKALVYFNKLKHVTGRLARWLLLLQQYSYDIVFVAGRENYVADYLSREAIINDLQPKVSNEENLDFVFATTRSQQKQIESDKNNNNNQKNNTNTNVDLKELSTSSTRVKNNHKNLEFNEQDLKLELEENKRRKRPANWRELTLYVHQFGHPKVELTMQRLKMIIPPWHNMHKDVKTALATCHVCYRVDYTRKIKLPLKLRPSEENVFDTIFIEATILMQFLTTHMALYCY